VYKGIDREEGYEVAWNCFQTTKQEYAELSQEVEILKRVRHPNIINFHDCWYSNTEFIFITELMTSGTLREYVLWSICQRNVFVRPRHFPKSTRVPFFVLTHYSVP